MQRLHVVGVTKDQEGLILSARRGTKTGGWTVNVDAEFEEFVAALLKDRGSEAEPRIPRAESQLSVREMQQRLRAGQSIRQVARAAGVHDDWVERFAVPIQAEQTQIVRQALDLTFSKQRLGVSSQPLGTSVWWNLQDRSVLLPEDGWETGWTAFLVRDSKWVVRFSYEARKRNQSAEWEVDLRERSLTSRNRLATELGYVESGRRRRPGPPPPVAGGLLTRAAPAAVEAPPAPEPPPEVVESVPAKPRRASARRRPAAKKSAAKKATAKKATAKKATAKKSSAKKATAKTPATTKRVPKKAPPKRAAAKKAPPKRVLAKSTAKRTVAKKTAPKRPAPRKSASPKKAPASKPPTVLAAPPPALPPAPPVVYARPAIASPALTPAPAPAPARRRLSLRRR